MDSDQIRQLGPKLTAYLDHFADCFSRTDTHAHRGVDVRGPLADVPEQSVEPLAREAGVAPRTLPECLSPLMGHEDRLRDRLPRLVVAEHPGAPTIGLFDETRDVQTGDKTPGVQKQGGGRRGKTENGSVTVHLGFARGDVHCRRDGELFLPESGDADRDRGREAGLPDDRVYRPQGQIALELSDRAVAHGLRFDWLTCDEGSGGTPERWRELATRPQRYVAEGPRRFTGWLDPPRVVTRSYPTHRRGRGRKVPRRASGSRPAQRVAELLDDPRLRDQPWQRFRVKDGVKGPMVGECNHGMLTVPDAHGRPGETLHLVVARNVLEPEKLQFFVSHAPPETRRETWLVVAFSRGRVERCFEDDQSELGLDQYEGRR